MTVDAAAPQDGRFTRGRRAFRRWRKARPFWGGLFLILSGLELLYSGNLSLGNIEIHLGLIGFYSYIIPLVVILCGALTWTLPSQRLFYGIVGNAAVVYSIVSVNLGGFLIGLLLGIVGGALSIAWVPDKRRYDRGAQPTVAGPNDDADGPGPDDTGSGLPIETDVTDPNDFFARPTDVDATTSAGAVSVPTQEQQRGPEQNVEGEQRHPFRVRRHALDDSQRPAGDSGRHGGRALVIAVVGTTLAASAAFAVRYASPAAADTCTPTPLQSAIARAVGSSGKTNGGNTTGGNTNGGKSNGSGQSNGGKAGAATHKAGTSSGTSAPITAAAGSKTTGAKGDQPKPVASVIGGVVGLLGSVLPAASGSATDAATDAPTDPPSDPPSAPPTESPSPSAAPTENPTPTESPTPTPRPTVTSKPRPTPTASGRTATTRPRPVPTTTPTTCRVTPKTLAVAPGQPTVNEVPSTQRAALLTMSGLSYDGNVALPTANGTIEVMQFSMTKSTSTPFELDVPVGDHEIVITSSSLTVSGTVKFFTTEIKGNLDGALPIDFTPSSPPPLTVPELSFTDAVISLVFVQSTTLTADALTISPS